MPAPEPGECWGILGGVFDPIHLGHIHLAREIRIKKNLDGILFVPACRPPHRPAEERAPFADRVAMLRLAVVDHENFEVSAIEEDAGLSGFTLDTVRELRASYPDVSFCFLIGADNLGSFMTWHQWRQLLKEITLLVGSRPGSDPAIVKDLPEDAVELVDTGLNDVSSTVVRSVIRQGTDIEKLGRLVPRPVAEYVLENKLYL
jgi:nicotinate-nucleotide adenylyltransferase